MRETHPELLTCPGPKGSGDLRRSRGRATAAHRVRHTVVSMFSGCGGMDLGFRGGFEVFGRKYASLPFDVAWANDANAAACRTYRHNLGSDIAHGDVWTLLDTLPQSCDVVVGGFPCQDISVNGKGAGVAGARSGLYRAMVCAVARLRPKIFVAENVKGLLMRHNRASLRQVVADFSALGYAVSYHLYQASDYGVPQRRERVFIVGTAPDTAPFRAPEPPAHFVRRPMTAMEALEDLQDLPEAKETNHTWSRARRSLEQGDRHLRANRPAYTIRAECHGNIQYHYALKRRISMREAARIQSFPDTFVFQSKLRETERQVGNAVPPVLAWHIAAAVHACLEESVEANPALSAFGTTRRKAANSARRVRQPRRLTRSAYRTSRSPSSSASAAP